MAANEKSSRKMIDLASKALRKPDTITKRQIRQLAGSVLTQAPDRKKK